MVPVVEICPICKVNKKKYGRSYCYECMRKYQRSRYIENREKMAGGITFDSIPRKKHSNNTSGYTGIYLRKDKKFLAQINQQYIGIFKTIEEAIAARTAKMADLAAKEERA